MTFSDLFLKYEHYRYDHLPPAHAHAASARRSGLWATPHLADLRVFLFLAVTWLFLSVFAGRSAFVMALATALTLCVNLIFIARHDLSHWTHYIAWTLRIGAVITAWWLFVATPTIAGSLLAVLLFAGLYTACERSVWRRLRQRQSA